MLAPIAELRAPLLHAREHHHATHCKHAEESADEDIAAGDQQDREREAHRGKDPTHRKHGPILHYQGAVTIRFSTSRYAADIPSNARVIAQRPRARYASKRSAV